MQQAFDSQLRAIQMLADQVQAFPGSIAEDVTQHTVRLCGIGTGISEASKTVPILSFATQGGKQASSYFRQRNWVQAVTSPRGSDPVPPLLN